VNISSAKAFFAKKWFFVREKLALLNMLSVQGYFIINDCSPSRRKNGMVAAPCKKHQNDVNKEYTPFIHRS
jgi:hypothetical protein